MDAAELARRQAASPFRDMMTRRREEARMPSTSVSPVPAMAGSHSYSSNSYSSNSNMAARPREPSDAYGQSASRLSDMPFQRRIIDSVTGIMSHSVSVAAGAPSAATTATATATTGGRMPRSHSHNDNDLSVLGGSSQQAQQQQQQQQLQQQAHLQQHQQQQHQLYTVIPPARKRPTTGSSIQRRMSNSNPNMLSGPSLKVTGTGGPLKSSATVSSRPSSSARKLTFSENTKGPAVAPAAPGMARSDGALFREYPAGGAGSVLEDADHETWDQASRSEMSERARLIMANPAASTSKPRLSKNQPELPPWNSSTRPAHGVGPGLGNSAYANGVDDRPAPAAPDPARRYVRPSSSTRIPASKSEPALKNIASMRTAQQPQQVPPLISRPTWPDQPAIPTPLMSPASRFDQLPEEQPKGRYRATPLQWDVYTRQCPSKDEQESPSFVPYVGPSMAITHAYRLANHSAHPSDLARVVNHISCLYSVLRTRFYRNERIIDADVEGILDKQAWEDMPLDAYLEVTDAAAHPLLSDGSVAGIGQFLQAQPAHVGVHLPFSVMLITYPPSPAYGAASDSNAAGGDDRDTAGDGGAGSQTRLARSSVAAGPSCVLVFRASLAVADEVSLTWIARETVLLYRECYRLRKFGKSDMEVMALINRHESVEQEEFADFANECKRSKSDMAFWRDQCIEVAQDTVERSEKDDLEGQLKRLAKEKYNLKASIDSLAKRKVDLEAELKTIRQQRKEIDKSENGEGGTSTYIDPATNEMIQITRDARAALLRAVLGDDSTDNIMSLLDKHEVPKEAQRKINAPSLTLETFASISESQVEDLGLMSRDRRKILALADYVRNRIKDCLHEQTKVKFALERRIAKAARDYESCVDTLRTTQNQLEANDDLSIRLNYILKPPYVETRILPITLAAQYEPGAGGNPFGSSMSLVGSANNLAGLAGGQAGMTGSNARLSTSFAALSSAALGSAASAAALLTAAAAAASGARANMDTTEPSSRWGFVPLRIEEETLENLRRFRSSWAIGVKNRRKQRKADPNLSSDNESLLDSEDSLDDDTAGSVSNLAAGHEFGESLSNDAVDGGLAGEPSKLATAVAAADDTASATDADTLRSASFAKPGGTSTTSSVSSKPQKVLQNMPPRRMKVKSVDVVCLAAFAVLIKHITGIEKYLVGITQSYRRHGLYVGPLTDTMPVRVDMTKKGLTFDSLFASLFKVLKNTRRKGVACTKTQVATAFGMPGGDLDVRFEFIPFRDTREWVRRGVTIADLLQRPEACFKTEGIQTERLWTNNEADQYDLKLVIVETLHGLEGGMRFLNSRFDEEKIAKWMAKFQATLEGIDYGPRKIPVSSLISRFYHTVWQGSSSNLGSIGSLYSSLSSSIGRLSTINSTAVSTVGINTI